MNVVLIAILTAAIIGIVAGLIIVIRKYQKGKNHTQQKATLILIPIVIVVIVVGVVLCVEHFSEPVMEASVVNQTKSSTGEQANSNNAAIGSLPNQDLEASSTKDNESVQSNTVASNGDDALEVDVDWQTYSYEVTDNNGYSFRITLVLTPFALVSKNTDYLESAWNSIEAHYSTKHALPTTLASWDLDGKGYQDMYYSVGEVEIKNITSGWDITDASSVRILFEMKDKDGILWFKPFFGNSSDIQAGKLSLETTFKKNIGSFPLIILRPESFNPKNPDGLYRDYLESTEFKVLCQWINAGSFSIPLLQE